MGDGVGNIRGAIAVTGVPGVYLIRACLIDGWREAVGVRTASGSCIERSAAILLIGVVTGEGNIVTAAEVQPLQDDERFSAVEDKKVESLKKES